MFRLPRLFAYAGLALLLTAALPARAQDQDPPSRVARLSFISGEVSLSPAGEREFVPALLNRPQIRGDRLWTERRSRAELQVGTAALRMGGSTSVELLDLDDRRVQVQLNQGTLNLRVRRMDRDQSFEIDTPTLALVISEAGDYRVDVDDRGRYTEVIVWDGRAKAYGERSSFSLREGDAIRFADTDLDNYEPFDQPQPDDFDRFCQQRNYRFDRSPSLRYVPDDLVGYSDLDDNGSWSNAAEYGNVWFPNRVDNDWAPYRDGRWIWQDPWGWTWVDNSAWGFAPFHYGRWVQVNRRWGWVPCPPRSRPIYAPALVAFVGGDDWYGSFRGGGRPVGWFPLGPRDIYVPGYRGSRDYFGRINSNNTVINITVINSAWNDYSSGRGVDRYNYMHRRSNGAYTVVPGDVFSGGRSVYRSRLQMDNNNSARAQVERIATVAPGQRSVYGADQWRAAPAGAGFDRRVMTREAPPPAQVPFSQRTEQLQRNPGVPLGLGSVPLNGSRERDQRVQVVGDQGREIQRNDDAQARRWNNRDDGRANGQRHGEGERGNEGGSDNRGQRDSDRNPGEQRVPNSRERDDGSRQRQQDDAARRQREADQAAQQQRDNDARDNRGRDERGRDDERRQQGQGGREVAPPPNADRGDRFNRQMEQQQQQAARDRQQFDEMQAQAAQQEREQQQRRDREAQGQREADQQRAGDQQRELQRQQREQQQEQQRQAQAQAERDAAQQQQQRLQRGEQERQAQQQREAERQQRDAERAQQAEQQRQGQQQRELERQQQAQQQAAQMQQAQQQREAERQQREAERAQQQAAQQQQQQQAPAQNNQPRQEHKKEHRNSRDRDNNDGDDNQQ